MLNGRRDAAPVLLYDGSCAFCRRLVARLGRLDREGRIACVPSRDRPAWPGLPALTEDELTRALHLVRPEGPVLTGARALPAILRLLPLPWRLLAPLFRIPGVQPAADRVYAWIAARRHRLGCGPAGCGRG